MATYNFTNSYCNCTIQFITRDSLHIKLVLTGSFNMTGTLYWWAAAPPQRGISLSGSCMPYPNALIAYDNTINRGIIPLTSNIVEFDMKYPNAYYIGLGSIYVAPHINFKLDTNNSAGIEWTVPINAGIPYRMLTQPPSRTGAEFYKRKDHGVRSQEQTLRDSQYPCGFNMAPDFWGGKPPS